MQKTMFCAIALCALLLWSGAASTFARQISGSSNRDSDLADSISFLKQFHIGMTYDEVQRALPATLQQDALAYNTRDNVFLLGVGKSANDDWSAYLMFDSSDLEIKKPERLIEIDCSSTLTVLKESFESVVDRVSGSFGPPSRLDTAEKTSRAGWQTAGGSLLTLEYTRMPGAAPKTQCVVDFVIRSSTRKQSGDTIA